MSTATVTGRCRHGLEPRPGRICPDCRRDTVIAHVAAAGVKLSRRVVADALDAVVAGKAAVLRSLAAALDADPGALSVGAPTTVARLVTELIARGAALAPPACVVC